MSIGVIKKTRNPLYCSFCGKRDDEVGYLVAGPSVFICNECVELCREIGQSGADQKAAQPRHEGDDMCPPEATS